jgi:hypothetical protein
MLAAIADVKQKKLTLQASNGFRACGIFPLNKNAIPDNAFMPSTVSDIPLTDASTVQASGGSAVTAPAAADLHPPARPSVETPIEPAEIMSPVIPDNASTVSDVTLTDASIVQAMGGPSVTAPTTAELPSAAQSGIQLVTQMDPGPVVTLSSTPSKAMSTTFANLHPTPKINRTRRAGGNKTQKAAVLTTPEYRLSLSDKLASSDNNKKTARGRRLLSSPQAKKAAPTSEKNKPKKTTKAKASNSKKAKGINNAPATVNYYCGGCGELYDNSRSDWLQCVGCLEWWELDCSGMLGKSKKDQDQFRCTDCAGDS